MRFSPSKLLFFVLPWTLAAVFAITTLIAFLLIFLFKNSPSISVAYTAHEIGNFDKVQCEYLLGNKLGWNMSKGSNFKLTAEGYNSSSTTLDISAQKASVLRLDSNKLQVSVFGFPEEIWNVESESEDGLIATNTRNEYLAISKKSGLLIYSTIYQGGSDLITIPNEEASMFSCK